MQKLIEGIHKFREEQWGKYHALFSKLSKNGQNPHTLFITCSDSRVIAEMITQSKPGDLFVVKNVGNIVPPYPLTKDPNSTAAAIEFAVTVLNVSDIVVCGHSQCGAMQMLLTSPSSEKTHLKTWIDIAFPVKELIEKNYQHLHKIDDQIMAASEENVLFAIENLYTYPFVAEKLKTNDLRIHGWFFKISTGEISVYEPKLQQFSLVT